MPDRGLSFGSQLAPHEFRLVPGTQPCQLQKNSAETSYQDACFLSNIQIN